MLPSLTHHSVFHKALLALVVAFCLHAVSHASVVVNLDWEPAGMVAEATDCLRPDNPPPVLVCFGADENFFCCDSSMGFTTSSNPVQVPLPLIGHCIVTPDVNLVIDFISSPNESEFSGFRWEILDPPRLGPVWAKHVNWIFDC